MDQAIARQWWEEQARQKGMDGAPQLVQQVLEERAARGLGEAENVADPELTKLPKPQSVQPLNEKRLRRASKGREVMADLANGAPSAPSKFDLAPSKRKRGKILWKWQVTAFLKGDKVASQTVHNSELAKDLEVHSRTLGHVSAGPDQPGSSGSSPTGATHTRRFPSWTPVARALQLDDTERDHLFALAKPTRQRPAAQQAAQEARSGLLRVLENISDIPALIALSPWRAPRHHGVPGGLRRPRLGWRRSP